MQKKREDACVSESSGVIVKILLTAPLITSFLFSGNKGRQEETKCFR